MKLHGDLNPISLAELFKSLSDQRATGVLSVTSPMGEKHIAMARGEITVFSDRLAERMRLGDLLVARGKLSEEGLAETLKAQRASARRARFGEVLVEKGLVKRQDIEDAVKFQVEEEICDLFTWREAVFEFDEERSSAEVESEILGDAGGEAHVHQLSVDPSALILEASRRLDDWKIFDERLPTPYLCFKLTAKGAGVYPKANPANQRILRLVREGRTLENVVKLSYLGRFQVYKSTIRFLDDGWILPYGVPELRFLASDHRAQRRYADALNLYRRLLELSDKESDRVEYRRQIEDTIGAILKAQAAGDKPEGLEFVSHKEAAESFKLRRRLRYLALAGLLLVCAALGLSWWLSTARRLPPPEIYLSVIRGADLALEEGDYAKAMAIWQDFFDALKDPEDAFAQDVRTKLHRVLVAYQNHVQSYATRARQAQAAGKWDEAEALYAEVMRAYPDNPLAKEIHQALKDIPEQKLAAHEKVTFANQQERLRAAQDLEARKAYPRAKALYREVSEGAAAGSDTRRQAEEGLARLQSLAGRLRDQYQIGLDQLRERKAAKALATFQAMQAEWPELEWVAKARQEALGLRMKQDRIREGLTAARAAEGRGETLEALAGYRDLERDFGEFEEVQALREHVAVLGSRAQNAEDLLQQAQAADKAGKPEEARAGYAQLLKEHRAFLTTRRVKLPLQITSQPPGATVRLDGQAQGRTPLRLELSVEGQATLTVELPGYAPWEHRIGALAAKDLELTVHLERAVLRTVRLPATAPSKPALHAGQLLLAAGGAVVALAPDGAKTLWTSEKLVDERAARQAEGEEAALEGDATWWQLKDPPQPMPGPGWVIATRAREIWTLNGESGAAQVLLKLPSSGLGALYVSSDSSLAGKPLLAAACLDGKVRVYEAGAPKPALWTADLDTRSRPACLPVSGVLPAGAGAVAAASRGGHVQAWNLANGQTRWSLNLKEELAGAVPAAAPGDARFDPLCVFLTAKGGLIALDLERGQKLWELPPARPSECISSAVAGPSGLYVLTREGALKGFARNGEAGAAPKMLWEKRLDESGPAPQVAGGKVFAASRSGNLFALSAENGKELWRHKCATRPLHLTATDKRLYVVLAEGDLEIFEVE